MSETTTRRGAQYVPGDRIGLEMLVRHRANLKWVGVSFRHESDDTAELVAYAESRYSEDSAEPLERRTFQRGLKESKYQLVGRVPPDAPVGIYRLHKVSAETVNGRPIARSGTEELGPMASAAVEVLEEVPDDTEMVGLRFTT